MARGWESKSVEEQQAAADTPQSGQRLTPRQIAKRQREETILLSRKHVVQQLQAAQNPLHRKLLERALAHLDSELTRQS